MRKANLQSLEKKKKSLPVISVVHFVHKKNGISLLPKHLNCECATKWLDTALTYASKDYNDKGFLQSACVLFEFMGFYI